MVKLKPIAQKDIGSEQGACEEGAAGAVSRHHERGEQHLDGDDEAVDGPRRDDALGQDCPMKDVPEIAALELVRCA